jgi:hypothetical protein
MPGRLQSESVADFIGIRKYRLYFGKDGVCLVRFDNEQGKGDHQHINGVESPYCFTDIPGLLRDFRKAIQENEVYL